MKNVIILCIFLSVLIIPAHSQTQADTSDAVWSIVIPSPASQDINMNQCLLGKSVDSLISKFVRNAGAWNFRVDSIYFSGADASSFKLISGIPKYIVPTGSSHSAEFLFRPSRVGIHTAQIVIITQADTLIQNIRGEGVLPVLSIVNSFIDFGKVPIGDYKDTISVITIKNI